MQRNIRGDKMNCWHCNNELIWGCDFDYKDYGIDGKGIVSTLHCPKCEARVEVYKDIKNDM